MPSDRRLAEFDFDAALTAILDAPYSGQWTDALAYVAAAGGGWGGQLVGVSRNGNLLFDHDYNLPKDAIAEFEARSGVDPALNPRAEILRKPEGVAFCDDDFMPEAERERHPFYAEFLNYVDAPQSCLAKISLAYGALIAVCAIRSKSSGPAGEEDKRRLEALIPHMKAATRLQSELEHHGAQIALGAYEPLEFPVFLLNEAGHVIAQTGAADAFLREQRFLQWRRGRLNAIDAKCDTRLQDAIGQVVSRSAALPLRRPAQILLRHEDDVLLMQAAPLPPASMASLRLGAVAILTIPRWRPAPSDPAGILREAFGLSTGEAAVALLVGEGVSISEVASRRMVSPLTIKTQLKSIFRKTGAGSQVNLARILNSLR